MMHFNHKCQRGLLRLRSIDVQMKLNALSVKAITRQQNEEYAPNVSLTTNSKTNSASSLVVTQFQTTQKHVTIQIQSLETAAQVCVLSRKDSHATRCLLYVRNVGMERGKALKSVMIRTKMILMGVVQSAKLRKGLSVQKKISKVLLFVDQMNRHKKLGCIVRRLWQQLQRFLQSAWELGY